MSSGRIGAGLRDADPYATPSDDYRRSVQFLSLTGVAVTRLWNGDWFYAVDTSGGNVTVTLPTVGNEVGHHHIIKRTTGGGNACNIVADDGSAILDGSATHSIAAQYEVRCYFSDGVAYRRTDVPAGYLTSASASAAYLPIPPAWVTYTPGVASSAGTITSYSATGATQTLGKLVHFKATAVITDAGTGSGYLNIAVPHTMSGVRSAGSGYESVLTGFALAVNLDTATSAAQITEYDGTTCIATGARITVSGSYEIA